jgi:hypothetical protein
VGICPERFKYSVVRPVYKKGDKTRMTKYRPISLLISFSKILETIMLNRLNQHLQTNSILVPEQFGFRKDITIQQAIFTLTDSIHNALNPRQQVGGIFCDISKAFDCINHKILIDKLQHYGVCGVNIKWFESYVADRKQRVDIISPSQQQKVSSRWEESKYGINFRAINVYNLH